MYNLSEKGAIPVLLLIAGLGLVVFLMVSQSADFKNKLFAQLFPKPGSYALSGPIPPSCNITNALLSCPTSTSQTFSVSWDPVPNALSYHDEIKDSSGTIKASGCENKTSFTLNVSNYSLTDTYTVYVTAYDAAFCSGNILATCSKPIAFDASCPTPTPTPTPTPFDSQNPTVSITNPKNGSIVRAGSTVKIAASASDNVAVSKVEFYVAGKLLCTTLSPSTKGKYRGQYECSWDVPTFSSQVTYPITAKAYDTSNNSAQLSISVTSK